MNIFKHVDYLMVGFKLVTGVFQAFKTSHKIIKFKQLCSDTERMQTKYITPEGLKQLDNYSYKSGGYTWLDSKMNYFWEYIVEFVPKNIAPNTITFLGWLLMIGAHSNMLRYDYTFKKDLPPYVFVLTAICLFIYMTLDAIDGKQARRTKTSSPLGQLFDHGCDSFSVTFLVFGLCQAVKFEVQEVFLVFIICQLSFWVANWSQYHTGVLTTRVGQLGVTQAEFTIIFIHLLTATFGQDMWSIQLKSLLPFTISQSYVFVNKIIALKVSAVIVYACAYVIITLNIYLIISTALKSKQKKRLFLEHLSFVILVCMEIAWSRMSVYKKYCGLILLNFGLILSLMICKLIICSVTKMKFSPFHIEIVPLCFSSLALYICSMAGMKSTISLIFYVSFVINILMIGRFLYYTINQITDYLGIYCFSIQKKQKIQ